MQKPTPGFRTQASMQKDELRTAWLLSVVSILDEAAVHTLVSLEGSGSVSKTPSNPTFFGIMWPQRDLGQFVLLRYSFFPKKHVSQPYKVRP